MNTTGLCIASAAFLALADRAEASEGVAGFTVRFDDPPGRLGSLADTGEREYLAAPPPVIPADRSAREAPLGLPEEFEEVPGQPRILKTRRIRISERWSGTVMQIKYEHRLGPGFPHEHQGTQYALQLIYDF